jgi:hypothetical protein
MSRFTRYFLPLLAIAVVGAATGSLAFAQTTGDITGTVTDSSGAALPGVTCTATSSSLQGSRTAVTTNSGNYRIATVPPGTYKVTCGLAGFATAEKTALVSLGSTATVNHTLQISQKEEIIVSGTAPVVDTSNTTTGSNYSAKVMEKLPLGRNYAAVVRLQPGVQEDTGDRQGRGLALSVYGSTSAENQFIIDGVNTNSVVRGVQGKIINSEFIQEVEVKTGGYQAEYGRATGGIINVITKSGGNEFHGDVFANYAPKSFRSKQDFRTNDALLDDGGVAARFGTFENVKTADYGADLGGYFIKDHLWFFTAYNYSDGERDRVPKSVSSRFFGVYNQTGFTENINYNLLSGKLTWNIAQGSTLVGTYFRDPEHHDGANFTPISTNVDEAFGRRDIGSEDYSGRFNQLFGSVGVLTLQYAKHNDRYLFKPLHPDIIGIQDRTHAHDYPNFPYLQGFGQVPGYRLNNEGKRDEYNGSFTAYLANHEIKLGGDYTKNVTTDISFFTGGQRPRVRLCSSNPDSSSYCPPGEGLNITNFYGEPVRVYFQHDFYAPTLGSFTILDQSVSSPPTVAYSGFVQDTWRIAPRFTLNAGVRLDIEKVKNKRDETTIDLNKEWQPRVGLVYDWKGDGSTKLFGSYGRFYYMIPNDLNVRNYGDQFQTSTFNYSITDTTPGVAGTGPPKRRTLVQGATAEPTEPGIKGQYQDEFNLGAEMAVAPTFAVGLKGMYRKLGRVIEDRCDLDDSDPVNQASTCAIINPGSGGFWDGGPNSTFGWCDAAESPFTSPTAGECFASGAPKVPSATRTFKGIELTARKTFTQNAWVQFSYLYSTLRGNYDGAVRVASGQTDPGINADYDYPLFLRNADGRLYLDRPHQLRLDALYTAPFGLSVGFGTYLRSGAPVSRAGYYNSFYPDLLHLVRRGEDSAIYSGARLPFEYEANLSLGYTFNVGPVSITPAIYVFNALNRQGVLKIDERFNPDGTFCENAGGCTPTNTPEYSQKNFERLGTLHLGDPLPQDNWGAPQLRQAPREVRVGLKVSF